MTAQALTRLHQSSAALPGTWKLGTRRAITLQPVQPGVLRVAHGRIWATFDGPHGGPPGDQGDHVLEMGDTLRVAAGQKLVIEAWSRGTGAYFGWDPLPQPVRARQVGLADLVQPLTDLRLALAMGARALARVAAVLLGAAGALVVPQRQLAGSRPLQAHCKA